MPKATNGERWQAWFYGIDYIIAARALEYLDTAVLLLGEDDYGGYSKLHWARLYIGNIRRKIFYNALSWNEYKRREKEPFYD